MVCVCVQVTEELSVITGGLARSCLMIGALHGVSPILRTLTYPSIRTLFLSFVRNTCNDLDLPCMKQ